MRKGFATLALAGALGMAIVTASAKAPSAPPPSPRPNILLIIADDVGQDVATGMYPGLLERLTRQYGPRGHDNPGYREIAGRPASTPNLNRFARQGMVFTDAWAEPFCSPTRASLLTGLYASQTHVITYADALSQHHDSFVRQLKDQGGYATAAFGKWHMAGLLGRNGTPDFPGMKPKEAGFDLYRGDMNAALPTYWNYPIEVQDAATAPNRWRSEKATMRSLPGIAPTTFADVAKAADTIDWIKGQERSHPTKPWFTWLAFNLSHATIRHEPAQMAIPDKQLLDSATIREIDACGGKFGTQDPGHCSGEAQMRAMTNAMDTIIGKILAVVDKVPNTFVIVIGDNGTPMYPERLGPNLSFIDNMYITRKNRGKGTAFESGARVEFAVRGPGIKPGSAAGEFVHVVDLYNTILALARLPQAKTVSNSAGDAKIASDSISLAPILTGRTRAVRDPAKSVLLTEDSDLMRDNVNVVGARNKAWKLVCATSADNCAFYNLADDPLEEYPLAKPGACGGPLGPMKADDPRWNYCYLERAVAERSILSPGYRPQS